MTVTQDELNSIKAAFLEIDCDSTGTINPSKLELAAKKLVERSGHSVVALHVAALQSVPLSGYVWGTECLASCEPRCARRGRSFDFRRFRTGD